MVGRQGKQVRDMVHVCIPSNSESNVFGCATAVVDGQYCMYTYVEGYEWMGFGEHS